MQTSDALVTVGQRYQIGNPLGRGGMGVVYRAYDLLTGQFVALKRIMAPHESLMFSSSTGSSDLRVSLSNEFQVLSSLRHPNIIGVLDYGFDQEKQPFFTMEVVPHSQGLLEASLDLPLKGKMSLLIQSLQALVYLHRRHIIHRDLKPSNVLSTNEHVKVLDFGLSLRRSSPIESMATTTGTLEYMAPELLNNGTPSESSDLYAIGIMAYQMLARRHPFETESIHKLIEDTFHRIPDLEPLNPASRLASVILRLLAKTPEERYRDAHEVIIDICDAVGLAVPSETTEIRESFIQNAQFMGRDPELAQLTAQLEKTEHGNGSVWLIGGESGVGKTRLLHELRTTCLVRGIFTLRGQAISEAGRPFQVWLDILRWLVLVTPMDDLELSVIKGLIPDIDSLLGRPVPEAPTLDPQAVKDRMRSTIEMLFTRQTQPVVLILEDLHWAGTESLDVLQRLLDFVEQRPLMIVGSYRDDEAPGLPNSLPQAHVLKLARLPAETVATLLESILGKNSQTPHVTKLLQQESEGNIYFLIEAVRVLAQEAGNLGNIQKISLPEKIVSGGIQRIIQRRLAQVPTEAYQLLEVAAIVGRSLDLELLHILQPESDLESWLTTCANAAVLESQVGNWHFAHDKLRQQLLTNLPTERRRALHEQVAIAIEQHNPAQAAGALMHHWHMAGDEVKEMHYAALAADQALGVGANREAVQYYEQALDLNSRLSPVLTSKEQRLQRAVWEKNLGRAHFALGQFREGLVYVEKATKRLGVPMPNGNGRVILGVIGQLFRQMLHRFSIVEKPFDADLIREAIEDYISLGEAYYFGRQILPTLYSTLREVNLAEVVDQKAEEAHSYSAVAVVLSLIPLSGLARRYADYANKAGEAVTDPVKALPYLVALATFEVGQGRWETVSKMLDQAKQLGQQVGDQRHLGNVYVILLYNSFAQGKFSETLHLYELLWSMSSKNGNVQHQIWALAVHYRTLLRLGNPNYLEEVAAIAQHVLDLSASVPGSEPNHEFDANATLALVLARMGDYKTSLKQCATLVDQISPSSATQSTVIDGYHHLCMALFVIIENMSDSAVATQAQALLKRTMKMLPTLAAKFPASRSSFARIAGLVDQLNGKPDSAVSAWRKSVTLAEEFAIPYEQASAHYELGNYFLKSGDASATEHLKRAAAIFTQLNARYDLNRVKRLLNRTEQ